MERLMEEIRQAIWNHDAKKVKELVEKGTS